MVFLLYAVLTSYKVAMDLSVGSTSSTSSDDSHFCKFWKQLCKLSVPHKVHHFAWRACRDILPTKENLWHRHVLNEELYKECKVGNG